MNHFIMHLDMAISLPDKAFTPFHTLPEFPPDLIDLLESSGYYSLEQARETDLTLLYDELEKANKHFATMPSLPTLKEIDKLLDHTRLSIEESKYSVESKNTSVGIVSRTTLKDLAELDFERSIAPRAIPLSEEQAKLISVDELAEAIPVEAADQVYICNETSRPDFNAQSKFLESIEKLSDKEKMQRIMSKQHDNQPSSSDSSLPGVTARHPISMYLAALVTTLHLIFLVIGVASLIALPFFREYWILIIPPCFMVFFMILYFLFASRQTCPVCHGPYFKSPKGRPHKDAHKAFIIGNLFPTALHFILFGWSRCMHCGTPTKVK